VTASFTSAAAVGDGGVNAGDTGLLLTNTNPNVVITLTPPVGSNLTDTATGQVGSLFTSTAATTTISYIADPTGDQSANLAVTNLLSQGSSESALTTINSAITYISAQDGYIGAQINTLNAVSQVATTQQENVVSAQNAVQATDYASATSNMSKYEILSQTGISALAQANSMEQEVTKLLQ
jgi:flagellin